jgi:hypothetical protein
MDEAQRASPFQEPMSHLCAIVPSRAAAVAPARQLHGREAMGALRRHTPPTVMARPARSAGQRAPRAWGEVGEPARWHPGVDAATRPPRPQVIPREPPSFVPRPPPPDWTVESERAAAARPPRRATATPVRRASATPAPRAGGGPQPWPTALLTLPAPVYQPLGTSARAAAAPARRRRRRWALGSYAAAVALASLAIACWQLYWMLESTEGGRALVERAATTVAALRDLF